MNRFRQMQRRMSELKRENEKLKRQAAKLKIELQQTKVYLKAAWDCERRLENVFIKLSDTIANSPAAKSRPLRNTRLESDAVWWKPWTWLSYHEEEIPPPAM